MINEKELVKKIKAARLIDCADPEATVLEIIKNMQRQRVNQHPCIDCTSSECEYCVAVKEWMQKEGGEK